MGGALRDRLLGLPVHDLDAVVAGHGREIAGRLAAGLPARLVLLGGKEFAAYRLVAGELTIDLWDRETMSLEADLARRDFTVNSFACDPRDAAVVDPFDGLGDLARRLLRATTEKSFESDPLRVLRLPRLTLQLPGFAAEPRTLSLARAAAPRLGEIAAERVRDELARILAHPEAHRGVALLIGLDLYPGLFLSRPGEPGSPGGALQELAALPDALAALREFAPQAAAKTDLLLARWAILLAHLPSPGDHLATLRDAGYLARRDAALIARLLDLPSIPTDEVGRRRFIHDMGPLWPTAALLHLARAGDVRDLIAMGERHGNELVAPPRLLSGDEVQEILGLPPGPEIGRALAAVEEAQIDGKVGSREEALALLARR